MLHRSFVVFVSSLMLITTRSLAQKSCSFASYEEVSGFTRTGMNPSAQTNDSTFVSPNFYISLDASVLTLGLINLEAPFGESELHLRGKSGGTTYIRHYFRVYTGVAAAFGTDAMLGLGAAYTGVLGRANHHMDISVGATYSGGEGVGSFLWPKVDLGYRYQKPDGGFLFKVFATTVGLGLGVGSTF